MLARFITKLTMVAHRPTRLGEIHAQIRGEVAAKLGNYVYANIDLKDGKIFYIGKGLRPRALAHLDQRGSSAQNRRIAINSNGCPQAHPTEAA